MPRKPSRIWQPREGPFANPVLQVAPVAFLLLVFEITNGMIGLVKSGAFALGYLTAMLVLTRAPLAASVLRPLFALLPAIWLLPGNRLVWLLYILSAAGDGIHVRLSVSYGFYLAFAPWVVAFAYASTTGTAMDYGALALSSSAATILYAWIAAIMRDSDRIVAVNRSLRESAIRESVRSPIDREIQERVGAKLESIMQNAERAARNVGDSRAKGWIEEIESLARIEIQRLRVTSRALQGEPTDWEVFEGFLRSFIREVGRQRITFSVSGSGAPRLGGESAYQFILLLLDAILLTSPSSGALCDVTLNYDGNEWRLHVVAKNHAGVLERDAASLARRAESLQVEHQTSAGEELEIRLRGRWATVR